MKLSGLGFITGPPTPVVIKREEDTYAYAKGGWNPDIGFKKISPESVYVSVILRPCEHARASTM